MSTRSGPVRYSDNASDAPAHIRVTKAIIATPDTPRNEEPLTARGPKTLGGSAQPCGRGEPAGDNPPRTPALHGDENAGCVGFADSVKFTG